MTIRLYDRVCPHCENEFRGKYDQVHCSKMCALKARHARGEQLHKRLLQDQKDHPEKYMEYAKRSQRGKHKRDPKSILELSKRTVSKICARMQLACSRCGWNEEACDLHHIVPLKEGGTNEHHNLSYLCPNCHRLATRGKVPRDEQPRFDHYVENRWRDFYFG